MTRTVGPCALAAFVGIVYGVSCDSLADPRGDGRDGPASVGAQDPWDLGPADWHPPSELVRPLEEVWARTESTYSRLYTFRNYGWDQVIAGGGRIRYCVQWDSSIPVTAARRDEIHAMLARQFRKWMDLMVEDGRGWNGWPYAEVPVEVVGWAVRERGTLLWSDDSVDIHVGDLREGTPQCPAACGRFFHRDGDYSSCPGGAERHHELSLWLREGMKGGAGGDWGQRIGVEYLLENLGAENLPILLHEMGHTFGLDDFYEWSPSGVDGFIMKAGSAVELSEFDKWMLRDWWRHLAYRYR